MTEIDVPDWVVGCAIDSFWRELDPEERQDPEWRKWAGEEVSAMLRAAMGAWVVPTKFQSRERFMGSDWSLWRTFDYPHDRDRDFDSMNNADGWQAERRDLFTLRQEKPE